MKDAKMNDKNLKTAKKVIISWALLFWNFWLKIFYAISIKHAFYKHHLYFICTASIRFRTSPSWHHFYIQDKNHLSLNFGKWLSISLLRRKLLVLIKKRVTLQKPRPWGLAKLPKQISRYISLHRLTKFSGVFFNECIPCVYF